MGSLSVRRSTYFIVRRTQSKSGIARRMRGAPLRQSVRSRQSLLPRWVQAKRSTDRRGKTVEAGARRTGFGDYSRNNLSFVRSPLLHDPRRGVYGESDHFCSSAFTTPERGRPDVILWEDFYAGSDFHLYQNPPCARLCPALTGR